jgi:hypothetical protein
LYESPSARAARVDSLEVQVSLSGQKSRGFAIACALIGTLAASIAADLSAEPPPDVPADWLSTVQRDIADSEYHVTWQDHTLLADVAAAYQAPNRAQNLRTYFTNDGIRVVPRDVGRNELPAWEWGLSYVGSMTRPAPCVEGNRVEYDHGDVVEWYVNDSRGLEQGFTVHKRQNDELRIDLAITGNVIAEVTDIGATVNFLAPGGARAIRFANLHAFDAAGRSLPSRFDLFTSPQKLSLVVDDRNAVYPITIDPLATSPNWTAESNQAQGIEDIAALFGGSVSTAGDVNGDGYSDVIVGARGYDNGQSEEGRAFVYHGSVSGLNALPHWTAEGDQSQCLFGGDVGTAGDVNGDGFGDVIIGASNYSNGQGGEGRALVYHGSATGLSITHTWAVEGNRVGALLGAAVSTAGDVNGDGYSDVIVGIPGAFNGRVAIHHGSPSGLNIARDLTLAGAVSGDNFGSDVATAGDVNGDGFSDVVVGASGRAYVFHGSITGLSLTAGWIADESQPSSSFGAAVAGAGDVNADGYSDVIVGAMSYDNDQTNEGRAYVYHGSETGLSLASVWTSEGNLAEARFGEAVSSGGDLNGDGYCDVVVGAFNYSNPDANEGAAFVYWGGPNGLSATAAWTDEGNQGNAFYGTAVSTAGDVNGDGYSDLIVGAESFDNDQIGEGRAFVYHGGAFSLSPAPGWTTESNATSSGYGFSVANAGDVNGDGYGDVVVGAHQYDNGQAGEGAAFVYHGSSSGPSLSADSVLESNVVGAGLGWSVGTAGDVTGDGYSDVVVGAWLYTNGQSQEGAAFVYSGSPLGVDTTPIWSAEGDQAHSRFGGAVGTAGDVNGDGYSDVIVGAFSYSNGQTNEGAAFVYHGSAAGLSLTHSWIGESNQGGSVYGYNLGTAGDVNGDGYSDVIVGAFEYSNGQSAEGLAFAYHGSAAGLSASPNWIGEANQFISFYGISVAGAGDVNGDGYSDVIVGAQNYDNVEINEGRAFVYHGSAGGLSLTPNWTAESNQASSFFGWPVAGAGDVNGDGYSDVIVGAYPYSNGQAGEGRAYVYHGSASGLNLVADWTAESNQAGANFGETVSTAGDVNGDGYSDVIVGAPFYDNGEADEGRAFIYYGNGGAGMSLRPQQRRADDSAPIDRLARSDNATAFRVAMLGRTPYGRTDVKLQWEVKPLGTAFDGSALQKSAAWMDTGTAGIAINELANGLACSRQHHWRARLLYHPATSPFQQYSRWFSTHSNGWQEADLRTPSEQADMNCDCVLDIDDVPAFVDALLDPTVYAANYAGCDISHGDMQPDGLVNGDDIATFTDLLVP